MTEPIEDIPRQVAYCTGCKQYHDLGRIGMAQASQAADWWLRNHNCPSLAAEETM